MTYTATRAPVSVWCSQFAGRRVAAAACRARIAAAVILLDRLKWTFELDSGAHAMPDGSFCAFSDKALQRALYPFAWTIGALRARKGDRDYVPPAIDSLLAALGETSLEHESGSYRQAILDEMQRMLLDYARRRLCRRAVRLKYEPCRPTSHVVYGLLRAAAAEGKAEKVAVHLVGAHLRFHVRMQETDDAVASAGRFHAGSASFYVVMRPKSGHFESMRQDAIAGLSPHLLVPRERLAGATENAEDAAPGRLTVAAIEDFVAHSLDLAGMCSIAGIKRSLRTLIGIYNDRVTQLEGDRSLRIELPKQLA